MLNPKGKLAGNRKREAYSFILAFAPEQLCRKDLTHNEPKAVIHR